MSLADYDFVLRQLTHKKWGSVFQIAIGGGEPTEHPDFIDIIKLTKKSGVVPNYTTNGEIVSDKIIRVTAQYCGAIAVSVTQKDIIGKKGLIDKFNKMGVKTNLHFLLSSRSIVDAIKILRGKYDGILKPVNAVVFLTYKPLGRATSKENLKPDTNLEEFLSLVNSPKTNVNFGFDACFVPLLIKHTNINRDYIDSCECGFFSVYIDELLNVKPCSLSLST